MSRPPDAFRSSRRHGAAIWGGGVLALLLLTGAFSFAVAGLSAAPALAAASNVAQCNGHGPGPMGATTAMTCTVTVVNTINHGVRSSRTTLVRNCHLGPCAPGNGTFTSTSTSLVTDIQQCNSSDNDAADTVRCDVNVINNISLDTPLAQPVTGATVNQCVGSGQGGGGTTVGCNPTPASTSGAKVTQCNGSGNGGGGTVTCTVYSRSSVSRAIPVKVNQCNGTGNPGGSSVLCHTRITTNLTAAPTTAAPTATAATGPTTSPTRGTTRGTTGGPTGGTAIAWSTRAQAAAPGVQIANGRAQVTRIPTGGVATGGGSTAPGQRRLPLEIPALLAGLSVLLWRRPADLR